METSKRLLIQLSVIFLLLFCVCIGQADSAADPDNAGIAYADKLFDNSYVHQIDIRLAEENWTGLLNDPIQMMKDEGRPAVPNNR
jgi:hypothetical protein